MSDTENVLTLLRQRWCEIFQSLREAGEVAPAQVLRCEGMMLLAAETGLLAADQQQQEMARQYQQVNGQTLEQNWGDRWSDFFEFPQIPAFAPRAPVLPSTPDSD